MAGVTQRHAEHPGTAPLPHPEIALTGFPQPGVDCLRGFDYSLNSHIVIRARG